MGRENSVETHLAMVLTKDLVRPDTFDTFTAQELLEVVTTLMGEIPDPKQYKKIRYRLMHEGQPVDVDYRWGVWDALLFMYTTLTDMGTVTPITEEPITVTDLYAVEAQKFRILFHDTAERELGTKGRDPDPYEQGFTETFTRLWNETQYLRGYAWGFMQIFSRAVGALPRPDQVKPFAQFLLGNLSEKR